ncbi:hypothetical protein HYH02_007102 [Chlamydomonas schloesseri]|uniref:Uncharacterized protein n=1 Tax=Chlamydomonas schloesseri TaxID=2026947 RepID=A0A835WID4_9CHLO|nr:hypothetical protein HYH02_007102 [Chlamydomonas schloesseri]|eukprot:KAG2448077.1 hypothetical protein HYH02_007102 [Chlamydomonas schloesseri]
MTEAALRDGRHEDPTCAAQADLRVLKDASGRDEMELDGVVAGDNKAFVLSHKNSYEGAGMIIEIEDKAQIIKDKSTQAKYAGTPYEQFKGKEVVPVFMAENTGKLNTAARDKCHKLGVRLYRRDRSAIQPWAHLKQSARAAAPASTMRWVL